MKFGLAQITFVCDLAFNSSCAPAKSRHDELPISEENKRTIGRSKFNQLMTYVMID